MKSTVFAAATSQFATDMLIERLGRNNTPGSLHIFVVPDRFTLSYEAEILEKLGLSGSFNINVMSFSRLARRFAGKGRKVLSPEAGVMLLRKVIDKNTDRLGSLKEVSAGMSFASDMYAAITDIRNNGISREALSAATARLSGSVKRKTEDISLIYSEYIKEIESGYSDSTTVQDALLEEIASNTEIASTHFYITDFYCFTGIQRKITERLMAHAASVDFAVPYKAGGGNGRIYPQEFIETVISMGKSAGVAVKTETSQKAVPEHKRPLVDGLFSYSGRYKGDGKGWFAAYYAKNPRDEAFYIARKIKAMVVEQGYRYKDFAIVPGDPEVYAPLFKEAFVQYGIPYFEDSKRPLSQETGFRVLVLAAEVVLSKFRRREVNAYLTSSLSGFRRAEVLEFLNYTAKYNIEYSRYLSRFTIEDKEYSLEILERVRKKLIADLAFFNTEEKTADAHIQCFFDFMRAICFDERLSDIAEFARTEGLEPVADAAKQTPEKINGIFADFSQILGGETMGLEGFLNIFASAAASVGISFVPLFIDSVFLGEAADSRYAGVRVMFAAGLTDGRFPQESSGTGLIGERDALAWSSADIALKPSVKDRNLSSRFIAKEILSKPSDMLFVSYPLADREGGAERPSQVFLSLCGLYGKSTDKTEEISALIKTDDKPLYEARRRGGIAETAKHTFTINEKPDFAVEGLSELSFSEDNGKEYISISKLERYLRCPFLHFVENGLRLHEAEVPDSSARDIGTVLHNALELFYKRKLYENISADSAERIAEKILEEVLSEEQFRKNLTDASSRAVLYGLKEELAFLFLNLSENQKHSAMKPLYVEAWFSDKEEGVFPEMELKIPLADGTEKSLYVRGKIDRIDESAGRVQVIDYKTSSNVDFGFAEVLYGKRIQLLVYMNAIISGGRYKPAGLFYLPLEKNFKSESEDNYYKYRGLVFDDAAFAGTLDDRITRGEKGSMYPVRIKKDGTLAASRGGITVSEEVFYRLGTYANSISQKAASEIAGGNIAISPAEGACKYCGAKDLCRIKYLPDCQRKLSVGVDASCFSVASGGNKDV